MRDAVSVFIAAARARIEETTATTGRTAIALLVVALTVSTVGTAASARPAYAFTQHSVLVEQTQLQWTLNHTGVRGALRVLGDPDAVAPAVVRCRGVKPVTLSGGGRGFQQVRCVTNVGSVDYLYMLDSHGHVQVRRVAPSSR